MSAHHIPAAGLRPLALPDASQLYELVGGNGAVVRSAYSIARTVLPPGCEAPLHYHRRSEEVYVVTRGTGRVAVDDRVIDVAPGDTLVIEPGARHRAMTGSRSGMEFLALSVPAYADDDFLTDNPEGDR